MKNSFLSELLKVLNEDAYCMLSFTTGFESINYKLKKKKKRSFICISACEYETLLVHNTCRFIKLKNCVCLFTGIRESQI